MKTSSVVRYLEAYTVNVFFGQTQMLSLAGYQGVRPKVMLMYLLNERNQLG